MFTRIGSLAISISAVTAGIIAGVAIGVLISAPDGPRLQEHTFEQFDHAAQEHQEHTCLVWWQADTPLQTLACERLK
jgi:hypothetical protein